MLPKISHVDHCFIKDLHEVEQFIFYKAIPITLGLFLERLLFLRLCQKLHGLLHIDRVYAPLTNRNVSFLIRSPAEVYLSPLFSMGLLQSSQMTSGVFKTQMGTSSRGKHSSEEKKKQTVLDGASFSNVNIKT